VSVALGIKYSLRMSHVTLTSVACPILQHYYHIISHGTIIKKKKVAELKMCFNFLQHILFQDEVSGILSDMYRGFHVN
jgi:hypothetical protein